MYNEKGEKIVDDFEWEKYTKDYYSPEMDQVIKDHGGYVVKDSKYNLLTKKIVWKDKIHFNNVRICDDVAEHLDEIKSVMECGCSCGYHLFNIKTLFPQVDVNGVDLLASQLSLAEKLGIGKDILDKIFIGDFIEQKVTKEYDYVFTNAVVMHLAHDKAIKFLNKMMEFNPKYIRMNENWDSHNWNVLFAETLCKKYVREDHGWFVKK